jgi:glycosyltransferase involved in cell wall biosynthesis
MKILHVTPHYHPCVGGAETFTKELSERLARRGHAVTVLALNGVSSSGPRAGMATEHLNGVTVRRFTPVGRLHGLLSTGARTMGARHLLRLAVRPETVDMWAGSPYGIAPALHTVRARPDVAAVINWYGGWLPFQICMARRLVRFGLVGVPLFHTDVKWAHAPVQAEMLQQCDAVVAMTGHERAFMSSVIDKVHAIGAGVDPEMFRNADGRGIRARYGIGEAPLVGYIGRMDVSKGVDDLIRAMQTVWRVIPEARLLLAGGSVPGPEGTGEYPAAALSALSAAERSRVVTTGRFTDDEKASLFAALDVFAMPSRAESFGIAYLEAWMCGKPVIAARQGATAFVIEDGVDGDLVAPGDTDALAFAVIGLLRDRERRHRLGSVGRAKTIARFTWERITDAVEGVYGRAHARSIANGVALTSAATVNSHKPV